MSPQCVDSVAHGYMDSGHVNDVVSNCQDGAVVFIFNNFQAEEMFLKMFDGEKVKSDDGAETGAATTAKVDLKTMAQEFGTKIEDYEFSPADLQDYLLVRKKEPASAVTGVEEWRKKWQEEKLQREEEKDAERARKSAAKEKKARKFREELEMAVVGANAKMKQNDEVVAAGQAGAAEDEQGNAEDAEKDAVEPEGASAATAQAVVEEKKGSVEEGHA